VLGIKRTGTKLAIAGVLLGTMFLAGCSSDDSVNNSSNNSSGGNSSGSNGNGGSNGGSSGSGSTTQPTTSPTPAPTPSVDESAPGFPGDAGEHEDLNDVAIQQGTEFTTAFAKDLTNRSLPTDAWRAAVIPKLYDDETKQLYEGLDPYSIPFCAAVSNAEIASVSTFTLTYRVGFVGSNSVLAIEVMNQAEVDATPDYKVLKMDPIMNDSGGC
jgi:hypothetical protein